MESTERERGGEQKEREKIPGELPRVHWLVMISLIGLCLIFTDEAFTLLTLCDSAVTFPSRPQASLSERETGQTFELAEASLRACACVFSGRLYHVRFSASFHYSVTHQINT